MDEEQYDEEEQYEEEEEAGRVRGNNILNDKNGDEAETVEIMRNESKDQSKGEQAVTHGDQILPNREEQEARAELKNKRIIHSNSKKPSGSSSANPFSFSARGGHHLAPSSNARGSMIHGRSNLDIQIREGGGGNNNNMGPLNTRKRTSGASPIFGPSGSGISPLLKKTNSESGLGLVATAEQSRPPQ